jgi:hypothetical protein
MEWGSGALALACLAAGGLHLVRLLVLRRDVATETSHAAMALGMAAMASPLGDPVPEPVWTAVFVAVATWFAALAVRTRATDRDAVHHIVGSGAMLFMLAVDHSGGHSHGAAGELAGLVPVTAMALTGYFSWHALRCVDRCRKAPDSARCAGDGRSGGEGTVAQGTTTLSLHTPQAGAVGHLVAAVAMSAMLLGMV